MRGKIIGGLVLGLLLSCSVGRPAQAQVWQAGNITLVVDGGSPQSFGPGNTADWTVDAYRSLQSDGVGSTTNSDNSSMSRYYWAPEGAPPTWSGQGYTTISWELHAIGDYLSTAQAAAEITVTPPAPNDDNSHQDANTGTHASNPAKFYNHRQNFLTGTFSGSGTVTVNAEQSSQASVLGQEGGEAWASSYYVRYIVEFPPVMGD
jgi:hypothetical protein